MMGTARIALLVLGMHRSGTSALGGALACLGATSPRTLLPPRQANPRGFWESAKLMKFHDRVLKAMGSSWDDWSGVALDVLPGDARARLRDELRALVADEYGHGTLLMVKDPRLCRLLPLWLEALPAAGIEPRVVLSMRHPLEVAASLRKRNGMGRAHALLLWLRHVVDAERHSRHVPRALVAYDALLADWRDATARISSSLGVPLAVSDPGAAAEVDRFLTAGLRHNAAPGSGVPVDALAGAALEVMALLEGAWAGDAAAAARLDDIRAWLDAADMVHAALEADRLAAADAAAVAR